MKARLLSLCIVLFLLMSRTASAQIILLPEDRERIDTLAAQRGPYRLMVTMGGGLSYYLSSIQVPDRVAQTQQNRLGIPATLRVMWYPDHRLRAGIETGWTTLYSYRGQITGEPTHVYTSMVPVLVVFSMPLTFLKGAKNSVARRLSISGGMGTFLNYVRLDYAGTALTSRSSLGWMASGSYTQPLGRRLSVAGELKWYDAVSVQNAALTAQFQLVWQALSW